MMTALLMEHGLWEQGWRFQWMNRHRTLGLCKYREKLLLLSTIYVDHHDNDHVRQTCLHEVAHALTPMARHGLEWQRKALELGVRNPAPCTDANMPKGRWQAACPTCSKVYSMHRPPKNRPGSFKYCSPCWRNTPGDQAAKLAASELKFADTVAPVVATMPEKRVSVPVSAAQSAPSVTVPSASAGSPNAFSAPQVAAAMKIDPKKFRAWLRRWSLASNYQTGPGGAYVFSADDVKDVVRAWNATH